MNFWHKYLPKITKKEIDKLYHPVIHKVGEPLAYPEITWVLNKLKKKKINMIIISSGVQKKLDQEIMDYGLKCIFQEVNGGVHNKAEEIYEISKRNNFKSSETAYLGDMDHDIESGKAAGVKQ
jgi:phosphoglycolate phosphatase-like HAD superfamily hydrolase